MTTSLTLRSVKGAPLTWDEVDDNFTALRTTADAAQVALSGLAITAATVGGTDKVLIQDADDSDNLKTVTASSIAALAAATWGGISGTLSNQTDLQNALDAKADSTDLSDYLPLAGGSLSGTLDFAAATGVITGASLDVQLSGNFSLQDSDNALASILEVGPSVFTYNGNTIWHAGNDGAGSGLDADTLDGNEAAAFALASHTHVVADITDFDPADYAALSGATFTGNIFASAGTEDIGSTATPFDHIYAKSFTASQQIQVALAGSPYFRLNPTGTSDYGQMQFTSPRMIASVDPSGLVAGSAWRMQVDGTTVETIDTNNWTVDLSSNATFDIGGTFSLRDKDNADANMFRVDPTNTTIDTTYLVINGIPTTNPGGTGRVWSDGGTLKIT